MNLNRFELGMKNLKKVDGVGGEQVIESLKSISPDLGNYIVEFAFGDIYNRKGLTLQERQMVTIASLLTTGGCEPQLEFHINGSLNVGIAPEEILEIFLQCIPYTGFPKVLNAISIAKKFSWNVNYDPHLACLIYANDDPKAIMTSRFIKRSKPLDFVD